MTAPSEDTKPKPKSALELLALWVLTVAWDHTGSFGEKQAWRCPYCSAKSEQSPPFYRAVKIARRSTVVHDPECVLGQTQKLLETEGLWQPWD